MTTQSATGSNYKTVAAVFSEKGFLWQSSVKADDVLSNSSDISFKDEWTQFSTLVSDNTHESVLNKPPKRNADDVWEKHFKNIISSNEAGGLYESHDSFSDALFDALRNSLEGFVLPQEGNDSNLILLKSSRLNVGFGKEIHRTKLGFKNEYALSKDSKFDHGCFVFGSMKRTSPDNRPKNEYYDVTAIVELKKESESCKSFSLYESTKIKPPNFKTAHGPLGQAMLYTMDVWHCLARRGVSVTSLPVVVLAGKSEETDSNFLCCVEAQIQIPEYCGNAFLYSVERIVSFDSVSFDRSACFKSTDETLNAVLKGEVRTSRDDRALAIYIRAMRIGLERAVLVSNFRNISDPVVPRSLCSQKVLKGLCDANLIASPIPCENSTRESGLHITQGELFELKKPTKDCFTGIKSIYWFVEKEDNAILTADCLVKVACISVHNTHVPLMFCKEALVELYYSEEQLKKNLSRVLLGFSSTNGKSLVLIMNDLRSDKYMLLNHQKICNDKRLPELWTAFCQLVKVILIPMADKDVIHVDIRSTSEVTYNILYRYHSSSNEMELSLIDFDSLVLFRSAVNANLKEQNHAIKATMEWDSAYQYLFWQVLWIAYSWHPSPIATSRSDHQLRNPHNSHNFVEFLFVDDYYDNFKSWLGKEEFKDLKDTTHKSDVFAVDTIETALEVLTRAFCRCSSSLNEPMLKQGML